MISEQWRPVVGFEGLYEVSDAGRVRSIGGLRAHGGYRPRKLRARVLKQVRSGRYFMVSLYDLDGVCARVRVHVLVAEAWLERPPGATLVRHRDDVGTNNHLLNLAWGTALNNAEDKARNGLTGKELTADDARVIKLMLAETWRPGMRRLPGELSRIAKAFGVSRVTVNNIEAGRIWKHA